MGCCINTLDVYMKKKCCERYYYNTIGSSLLGKDLSLITILHLVFIPPMILIIHLLPYDGLNIVLRTYFGVQLSIFNPLHAIILLFWLFIMYNFGTALVLGIFAALYSGISVRFWLKFASKTFLPKTYRQSKCNVPKFRLQHYQLLRLVATTFNESFAHTLVTCKNFISAIPIAIDTYSNTLRF